MSNDLSSLFPSLKLLPNKPKLLPTDEYIFHNPISDAWMSIVKEDVSSRDYALLTSLLTEMDSPPLSNKNPEIEKWMRYLYGQGASPLHDDMEIRTLQLSFPRNEVTESELLEAINAFFDENMILLFTSKQDALLIEQKSTYMYSIEDFTSFATVLESDFFIKPKIYIGKFHMADMEYPTYYQIECDWFSKGLTALPYERIFTMERVFPSYLSNSLEVNLESAIRTEILVPIDYDEDLLKTVRFFFENGFNGTVTAEKLHIHRNTLNYRLAKFQDITGISVRSFEGALVAYFASLLAFN